MSIDHPPVHPNLCELTNLNRYKYRTWDVVYLKLPVFPVTTWFPGDFRTVSGVLKDAQENRKVGSILLGPQVPDTRV